MVHASDAQKSAGSGDWLTLDSKTLEVSLKDGATRFIHLTKF